MTFDTDTAEGALDNLFSHLRSVGVNTIDSQKAVIESPAARSHFVKEQLGEHKIGYEAFGKRDQSKRFEVPMDQFAAMPRPVNQPYVYAGYGFNTSGPGIVRKVYPEDQPVDGEEDYWLDDLTDDGRFPSHSPDGFQCGYSGSGPKQLALAILFDHTGSPDFALEHYGSYKSDVTSELGDTPVLEADWVIEKTDLDEWTRRLATEEMA